MYAAVMVERVASLNSDATGPSIFVRGANREGVLVFVVVFIAVVSWREGVWCVYFRADWLQTGRMKMMVALDRVQQKSVTPFVTPFFSLSSLSFCNGSDVGRRQLCPWTRFGVDTDSELVEGLCSHRRVTHSFSV